MELESKIEQIQQEAESAIFGASDLEELEEIRVKYLGRNGIIRDQYSKIGQLPEEDRPLAGQALNKLNGTLKRLFEGRREALAEQAEKQRMAAESVDVTGPGRVPVIGKQHPLLATLDDMQEIFMGMGFQVVEGPEVEDYYHSFDALNYPEYHPAMDEQDTFYVTDDVLLRSQTSTVQIRVMEQTDPPVRIIAPGRCYRRDTVDATHSHTFYQLEGLLVDEDITFADLKGTLAIFAHTMYGDQCEVRFRPDFFPFTEPSAEIALTCTICGGEGCRVCSHTGFLEVMGAGEVDPNVLEGVGYDPERYTGFAFGGGIERFAMLRHAIDDIRLLYSGDMRFLNQF